MVIFLNSKRFTYVNVEQDSETSLHLNTNYVFNFVSQNYFYISVGLSELAALNETKNV